MAGYVGREGVAEAWDTDIAATLLVLQGSVTRVAIAAYDLALLRAESLSGIRKRIGDALGVPTFHVLLNWGLANCGQQWATIATTLSPRSAACARPTKADESAKCRHWPRWRLATRRLSKRLLQPASRA